MQQVTVPFPVSCAAPPPEALEFYRDTLSILNEAGLPYLVGGAYALNHHTDIDRHTNDFDIFIARSDYERIHTCLVGAGYQTELTYPHWLAKIRHNGYFIDMIFSSGNGVAEVDQIWFDYASPAEILGIPTRVCPVEETIWSKAFIMERERFDGADVAHLLLAQGRRLDWNRLLLRFAPHWRLLLTHLILFGFIYPCHRDIVPGWVMEHLMKNLQMENEQQPPVNKLCGGTLLSREQYLNDVNLWGFQDARVEPYGNMSEHDTAKWTAAIKLRDTH